MRLSNIIICVILCYSIFTTIYLIIIQKKHKKQETELDSIWNKITNNTTYSVEDLKFITEISKIRQNEIPWYERSISSIGIIGFFSMSLAASIQTVVSTKTEIESSNLRQEIKNLESQRNEWKILIKVFSKVIIDKKENGFTLEKNEESVLQQHLDQMITEENPSKEIISEMFKIYMALKQYNKASDLIATNHNLEEVSQETILYLAEMSYIDGARGNVKRLLKKFETSLSKQPIEWQIRFFGIKVAMGDSAEMYQSEVAALKRIKLDEAKLLLNNKAIELQEQSNKWRNQLQKPNDE